MNNGSEAASAGQFAAKWKVLAAVMLGVIMGPIDGTIVNVVLPEISVHFDADYALVQWVPTIYLLAICSFILFYGRLGDIYGYRRIYLTGLTGFIVASLLCGLSQSIWMLIVFRVIQGLLVAMEMALGLAIVISAFHPRERGKATGIFSIGAALGVMLGPVIGGMIAQVLSWRFVFFVNVPIGITALAMGYRVIPKRSGNPDQKLDVLGAVFSFIFLFSVVLYINRGSSWGWLSPIGMTMVGIAVVFGVLFFRMELKIDHPMLNLAVFKNRRYGFFCLSSFLNFMALYNIVFLTPWFLADALQFPVFKVGIVMMGYAVLSFFAGPISGSLSDRIGARGLTTTGMLIYAFGLVLMSRLNAESHSLDVVWRLALCGLGTGMFQSPMNAAAMTAADKRFRGIASSILALMRYVGMVFGIAVGGAIVYNLAPFTTRGHVGHFTPVQLDAFLNGLHWAYLVAAGISVLSAIFSFLAKEGKEQAVAD